MTSFSKESLELLRSRIDLVEALSPHVNIQRAGSSYKALCPFHDEKTPSFTIQKGDSHYHCFGCGAHGDAIGFMMSYLRMSFADSVEELAERFGVHLDRVEGGLRESQGSSKTLLKEALELACRFYQFYLLHTSEGQEALSYLYGRGIDLSFIRKFRLGFAPQEERVFLSFMREHKISDLILREAGLINAQGRDFFFGRIMIPILDISSFVIGFTARMHRKDIEGPKYINTPETSLFKKSKVLFGLNYSRKRIAKDRKAIIVEGQIDALRLIHSGFNWTVAGQGTAFGEEHVKELLQLGVHRVYLALDGDLAGQSAAVKIGDLFQKEGVEVWVVELPPKIDPDLFLQEKGSEALQKKLDEGEEYLSFLVQNVSKTLNVNTPAGKTELVQMIAKRIRDWNHPLMVHESLAKLAKITKAPESMMGIDHGSSQIYVRRSASALGLHEVDPDRILEADFLRLLILMGSTMPSFALISELNIRPEHFRLSQAKVLYEKVMQALKEKKGCDLLALSIDLNQAEDRMFLEEVLQKKKINQDRALESFIETVQRILERFWMQEREEIKLKIYNSGASNDIEVLELAKRFDEIKRARPQVKVP